LNRPQDVVVPFLEDELGLEPGRYTLTTPLFSPGLLDSFALVDLLSFAEQRFGIVVKPDDLTQETVDSVEAFVDFVESRRTGAARDSHRG
jgi:acyl carrier protein